MSDPPSGYDPRRGSTTTSSTSRASENSGATDSRAATTSDASGRPLRTSAIAGRAITASPSQFGATTTKRSTVV